MNNLSVCADMGAGLAMPFPTMIPVDVVRYGDAAATAGGAFVQWNTGPLPYLPALITLDPLAVIDAGRAFYVAGYSTSLPVSEVDASLGRG